MIEPTPKDVGRRVIYTPSHYSLGIQERGTITRVTDAFVFVLYDGDKAPKATMRECLLWSIK